MRKSPRAVAFLAFLLALTLGCNKAPAKVTVLPARANLVGKDASTLLKASVADSKGEPLSEIPVTWASSDGSVATVDADGKVTAKSTGEATITASAGKVSGRAKVVVVIVASLQVTLPGPGLTGAEGSQAHLSAKVLDEKGREHPEVPVTFVSSEPRYATVDKAGTVTLVASGPVTLTATAGKGTEATVQGDVLIQVPKFLKLTKGTLALKVGEAAALEFEAFDEKGRPCKVPPTFASSDENVVKVDPMGTVTGVRPGTADVLLTVGPDKRPVRVTVR